MHTVDQENVSATLTVPVPAASVFAVLADPATHAVIDGTGWVQEAVDRAPLTEAGQVFGSGVTTWCRSVRPRRRSRSPTTGRRCRSSSGSISISRRSARSISATRCATWPGLPHRRPRPERGAARHSGGRKVDARPGRPVKARTPAHCSRSRARASHSPASPVGRRSPGPDRSSSGRRAGSRSA